MFSLIREIVVCYITHCYWASVKVQSYNKAVLSSSAPKNDASEQYHNWQFALQKCINVVFKKQLAN